MSQRLREARRFAEARDWRALAERASPRRGSAQPAESELGYLYADALRRVGRTAAALELARRVEVQVRRNGDHRLLLRVLNLVGMTRFETGEVQEAERCFSELLEQALARDDDEFAARAANNLGVISNLRGGREVALAYYKRALVSYQRLGYLRGLAQTHYNLGISYRDLQRPSDADAHYRRAIEYAKRSASEDVVALAETERAVLCIRAGDPRLAERLAGIARERFERMGDPVRHAEALRVLAAAARADGRRDLAALRLEQALEISRHHDNPLLRAETQRDRGLLLRDEGVPAARAALLDAAHHFERLGAEHDAAEARALAESIPVPD